MSLPNQRDLACEITGFVPRHATACEEVAQRTNSVIMFREPGVLAQGLIDDNYSMKGFRIDTKSCNWGPMAGFVCMDPRFTKDEKYISKNIIWTAEALSGHIVTKFFGNVQDPTWIANALPIMISEQRIQELQQRKLIQYQLDGPLKRGISLSNWGLSLPWVLVPRDIVMAAGAWMRQSHQRDAKRYYVLCIDPTSSFKLKQHYPPNVRPIFGTDAVTAFLPDRTPRFQQFTPILGLCNPQNAHRGFKACVTADYDLFGIWPGKKDAAANVHQLNRELLLNFQAPQRQLPGGVARMRGVDDRLQTQGHREHHRFGDVSARVMLIKTLLNSAFQDGDPTRGNAIHHNDEAGNMALAKGSIQECFPVIAFVPGKQQGRTRLISDANDFKFLYSYSQQHGFSTPIKPSWMKELHI